MEALAQKREGNDGYDLLLLFCCTMHVSFNDEAAGKMSHFFNAKY